MPAPNAKNKYIPLPPTCNFPTRDQATRTPVSQGTPPHRTPPSQRFLQPKIWQLLPLQSLLPHIYNHFTSTLNVLIKVHDMCFISGLNSLAVCQTRRPQNTSVPRLPTHGPTEDSCGKRGLHVSFHRFCSCSKPDITRSIRPPRRGGWEWRQHVAQVGRLTWDRPQVWES